jgi:hypothetical protein
VSNPEVDPVKAVYELREAAMEHGKAIAELEQNPTGHARDEVLLTKLTLEEKTVAALDDCSENADAAAQEAVEHVREAS